MIDGKVVFEKTFGISIYEWKNLYDEFVKEHPSTSTTEMIADFLTVSKTKYKGKKRDALLVFAGYLLKTNELSEIVFKGETQ